MKPSYIIRIHSFSSLITNSSTEIYISADEDTIKSIKIIIDSILKLGSSSLTSDDLFEFSLGKEEVYDDYYRNVSLTVKPKNDTPEGQIAAKLLSNLTGLFGIDATYNG